MRNKVVFLCVCASVAAAFLLLANSPGPGPEVGGGIAGSSVQVDRLLEEIEANAQEMSDRSNPITASAPYALEDQDRVPTPEGAVDEVVRRLVPLALAGDARASLGLYKKLGECFDAVQKPVDAQVLAIYQAMGAAESFESAATERQNQCASDGTADFSSRGDWLERAAAGGLLEAKLLYAIDIDAFFSSPSEMIADPQALEAYKRKSVRYMTDLASGGNIDALMWMAGAYEYGAMLERSKLNSYAYYKAADLARPGVMPEGMLSHLQSLMSPSDQRRGEELARSIHARCCGVR